MLLWKTWDVASVTKQLHFKFYWIVINFNMHRYVWPMATLLDTTVIDHIHCCLLRGKSHLAIYGIVEMFCLKKKISMLPQSQEATKHSLSRGPLYPRPNLTLKCRGGLISMQISQGIRTHKTYFTPCNILIVKRLVLMIHLENWQHKSAFWLCYHTESSVTQRPIIAAMGSEHTSSTNTLYNLPAKTITTSGKNAFNI